MPNYIIIAKFKAKEGVKAKEGYVLLMPRARKKIGELSKESIDQELESVLGIYQLRMSPKEFVEYATKSGWKSYGKQEGYFIKNELYEDLDEVLEEFYNVDKRIRPKFPSTFYYQPNLSPSDTPGAGLALASELDKGPSN